MKKNIIGTILVVACIGFAVFINPIDTNAQGNLRYQNRYSKADVSRIISTLETSSNKFRRDFDKAMDRSRYNGTREEDRFNATVKDYENSLDRLRNRFNRNNSWWESKNEVSEMLRYAQPVNTMMNSISFRRDIERQWNAMRNDINTLADTFDLPGLNGGGWNGGPWNGGNNDGPWNGNGQMSSPPNWAVGTFYSTNGANITVTIENNGRVTVVNNGQRYWGTYYRGNMTVNGDVSTVTRQGNGFRTYNRNNGQTTIYSRTGGGTGGGWGNNPGVGGGNTSTPPSWAVGNFTSTNGSNVYLTILNNGQVTATVNGQMYYGTYYNGAITLNGDVSTVTRNGNGIRTYNTNNRDTTNYRRTN